MAINILTVLKNFLLTFKKSLPAKKQTTRKNKYRKIQEKNLWICKWKFVFG
jgi:hypothetical protein